MHLLASPVKTLLTVKGKVVKLSPASKKRVEQNEVDFQEVMLKDTDSHATVAVWDKMVNTLQKGECVTITKCRVRLFNEQKRLTTTRSSQCEKLAYDETLLLVSDDEDDDVDNNGNWGNTPISDFKSGTITAVFDVDPYLACPTTSCNNTKLAPAESIQCMNCKNCGRNYGESACNNYIRATVMIEVEDSNKPPQKVAIFKPQIEKLFTSRGFTLPSSNDQTELLLKFFEIIPVDIKFHMINNTIKQLTCKRVA
nr:uncharacterized protein LOC105342641 [Crassostrea gigas]